MIAELTGYAAEATDTSLYQWGRTVGPAIEAKASDARLSLVLLAQVAAAREQSMDVHTWRQTTARAEARWLAYLAATGYTLSEIEQAVVDNAATAERDGDAEDESDADTVRDESPADAAA